MNQSIDFFCLSHNNFERKENIKEIFKNQNLNIKFYDGVDYNDERIKGRNLDENTKRCWSIMYGHLDMIQTFLNSDKEYGIFCEDDILVRKDFSMYLNYIINNFKELNLDVLLLGYLCSNDIRQYSNFPEKPINNYTLHPFKYYSYDSRPESGMWGTQMYMLHKTQARFLINKYSKDYADKTIYDKNIIPFAADWTLTKEGNKAVIFPIIAIENGKSKYKDEYQDLCRKLCFDFSYSKEFFG
jgi:GR25 family glycosyltransferase involved in LPS biosynthesis